MDFAKKIIPLGIPRGCKPTEMIHSRRWDAFVWRFPRHVLVLRVGEREEHYLLQTSEKVSEGCINDAMLTGSEVQIHLSTTKWILQQRGSPAAVESDSSYAGSQEDSEFLHRAPITEFWSRPSLRLAERLQSIKGTKRIVRISEKNRRPSYLVTWKEDLLVHQQIFSEDDVRPGEHESTVVAEYLRHASLVNVHPMGKWGAFSLRDKEGRVIVKPHNLTFASGASWSWTRLGGVCWIRPSGMDPGIHLCPPNGLGSWSWKRCSTKLGGEIPSHPVEDWRGVVWAIEGENLIRLQPTTPTNVGSREL